MLLNGPAIPHTNNKIVKENKNSSVAEKRSKEMQKFKWWTQIFPTSLKKSPFLVYVFIAFMLVGYSTMIGSKLVVMSWNPA